MIGQKHIATAKLHAVDPAAQVKHHQTVLHNPVQPNALSPAFNSKQD